MEKFLKYNIKPIIEESNAQQSRFVISPLEKGFGVTLGNALRRTMLSNIPGASMFAIKIPNVDHEFQAINGIKEDVTQIILNLKNLVITINESIISDDELNAVKIEQWPTLRINKKGVGEIYASDIDLPSGFDVVNKDLYICSITTANTSLDLQIYATRGRNYRTFAQNKELINSLNIIATDSNFSPIIRVGYTVGEQKLSKTVTGDILTIDVATNGAISPQTALAMSAKILSEHLKPLIEIAEVVESMQIINEQKEEKKQEGLSIPIEDLNLSVRSYNCLKRCGIQTINELTSMTKNEVEKIKNLGKKSLREIQKQLSECGVSFKEE